MLQMYKGAINSPETIITNNISNTDTLIYVQDETKVPTDLPNLMVLGTGISAETIKVLSISGLAITVERAFQGTAKTWNAGTTIARNFTEYDYEALKNNVEELTDNQGDLTLLATVEQSNLVGAINENTTQLAQIEQDVQDVSALADGKATTQTLSATITTTWTGTEAPYTQTIAVTGIQVSDNPIVDIDLSSISVYADQQAISTDWSKIFRITTQANQITVYATDKSTVAIPIQLKVVR